MKRGSAEAARPSWASPWKTWGDRSGRPDATSRAQQPGRPEAGWALPAQPSPEVAPVAQVVRLPLLAVDHRRRVEADEDGDPERRADEGAGQGGEVGGDAALQARQAMPPQGHQHTRPQRLDLLQEVGLAGGLLVGRRVAVLRRPALHDRSDERVLAGDLG